jgi:hypothetical protein
MRHVWIDYVHCSMGFRMQDIRGSGLGYGGQRFVIFGFVSEIGANYSALIL